MSVWLAFPSMRASIIFYNKAGKKKIYVVYKQSVSASLLKTGQVTLNLINDWYLHKWTRWDTAFLTFQTKSSHHQQTFHTSFFLTFAKSFESAAVMSETWLTDRWPKAWHLNNTVCIRREYLKGQYWAAISHSITRWRCGEFAESCL